MDELLFLAFLLALIIGAFASMIGIGGGAINLPILMFLFSLDYKIAVGTSLLIIVCSSFTSALTYIKQRQIFLRVALCLAVPGLIASATASYLTQFIPTFYLSLFFGFFCLLLGTHMLLPRMRFVFPISYGPTFEEEKETSFGEKVRAKLSYLHLLVWGFISGCANGLTGIGGGIINVPAMVISGVPMHTAAATSSLVIFCASTVASLVHISLGHIAPLPILIVYGSGAMLGAFIGSRTSHLVPEKKLRFGFGVITILISFSIILRLVL